MLALVGARHIVHVSRIRVKDSLYSLPSPRGLLRAGGYISFLVSFLKSVLSGSKRQNVRLSLSFYTSDSFVGCRLKFHGSKCFTTSVIVTVPAYDNLKLDSYHSLSLIDALMRLKFTSIIVGIIN